MKPKRSQFPIDPGGRPRRSWLVQGERLPGAGADARSRRGAIAATCTSSGHPRSVGLAIDSNGFGLFRRLATGDLSLMASLCDPGSLRSIFGLPFGRAFQRLLRGRRLLLRFARENRLGSVK
jgi:hypothetical protein